jgi:hypothetical protein
LIVRDDLGYNWRYREVGAIFNVNKRTVHRIRSQAIRDIEHDIGRPPILQPDKETNVMAYITDSFQCGSPVSPKQIQAYVANAFGKQVSSSWTWRLVKRHEEALQRATAYPQENTRMEASNEIARTHIRNLERYMKDISTKLILNVNEVSCQEWSDRRKLDVIIPHQERSCRIEYAMSRKKHITCIVTISIAGDALMPLLVTHWRTIDAAVWEEAWRDGQNFVIRSNDTSYVTRPIFTEYVTSVILPYFAATRESLYLQDFTGVLLCDNCSSTSMKVSSNYLQTITSNWLHFHCALHICFNLSISSLLLPPNARNVRFMWGDRIDHKF